MTTATAATTAIQEQQRQLQFMQHRFQNSRVGSLLETEEAKPEAAAAPPDPLLPLHTHHYQGLTVITSADMHIR